MYMKMAKMKIVQLLTAPGREGIEDNSKINFLIPQQKHIL